MSRTGRVAAARAACIRMRRQYDKLQDYIREEKAAMRESDLRAAVEARKAFGQQLEQMGLQLCVVEEKVHQLC